MIQSAISQVRSQLNQYLRQTFDLTEDVAVLSNIVDQDGTVIAGINNKLVLFLVNIERDSTAFRPGGNGAIGFDRVALSRPPVFLNLYLMVAANFTDYSESLKFISNAVAFFQRSPVFDHQNAPDMDRRIAKLALDIENLNIRDLSTLWGALSGRYIPSVLYKVRTIMVDSEDVSGVVPVVRSPEPTVG